MPIATPASPIESFANLANSLGPLLLGSGTKTETGSVSPSGDASDAVHQLLATLMPQITGTAGTDDVVNNIISQAAKAFAPVAGQQKASGLYNTTVLKQLADEASANAVAQSSQAVLQHQTAAAQIAQAATGNLLQASKTSTNTAQTSPVVPPSITSILGGGILAASLAKKAAAQFKTSNPALLLPPPSGAEAVADSGKFDNPGDLVSAAQSGSVVAPSGSLLANTLDNEAVRDGQLASPGDFSASFAPFDVASADAGTSDLLAPAVASIASDVAPTAASTALDAAAPVAEDAGSGFLDNIGDFFDSFF